MENPAPGPPDAPAPMEFHDVSVVYRHKPVLYGVDAVFPAGQLIGIMGPNGAGKSTMLKAALGLLPLSEGWVRLFGVPSAQAVRRVAYVPQRESVDWDYPVNVFDVVLMGRYGHLGLFRRPGKRDRELAQHCLEQVEMAGFRDRQINNLSGGQQQRVFLARALAQESELYILDEPFAGVDATTEAAIIAILRKLRDAGKTVIAVHHDLTTAADYFDRLLLLNFRVIAQGPTAEVFTTDNLQKAYGGRLHLLADMAARRAAGNLAGQERQLKNNAP